MFMKVIKMGIIGCGDIANIRYFPSIKELDNFELAGIYDWDAKVSQEMAAKHSVKAYDSLEALLANADIDAVVVCTYHPSHAETALKALAAGKHVLVEKPLCTSYAAALKMKEAAEKSDLIFMALPYDEYPRLEMAKELLSNGTIGKITSVDGMFAHIGPLHAPWFFSKKLAKWGVLADLGVYPISVLSHLFGSAKAVTGFVSSYFNERTSLKGEHIPVEVEDCATAVIKWDDGKTATFRSNWVTCSSKDLSVWDLKFFGNEGILWVNMSSKEYQLVVYSPKKEIAGAEKITFNDFYPCYNIPVPDTGNEHYPVLNGFADAIFSGKKIPLKGASVQRQVHVVEIIEKLYQSSEKGVSLELETRI